MPRVAILKCADYDPLKLRGTLDEAFSLFGGVQQIISPGDKVLIKPNLLMKSSADSAVITHPYLIKETADVIRCAGAFPFVGDSPAFGTVRQVAESCGLLSLLEKGDIPLISLSGNKAYKDVPITATIRKFDKIINLPKLKAHCQMFFTGATKNLYGLISGKAKAWHHFNARGSHEKFSDLTLQIAAAVQPCFTIVDAVDIMDKTGPRGGRVQRAGFIFAGQNCLSIDRAICEIFGIEPEKAPLLAAASKKKLPGIDLNEIEICGTQIVELNCKGKYIFPEKLDNISFTLPRVIKSVFKHLREKYGRPPLK